MSDNKFTPAGNYSFDDIVIYDEFSQATASIKPIVSSVTITESIDLKYIYGTIIVADVNDTLRRFPLYGHELISVAWQTPTYSEKESEPRSHTFRIDKITNVTPSNGTPGVVFRLDIISDYAYHQSFLDVSEAFSDTISNVVQILHDRIVSEPVGDVELKSKNNEIIIDSTDAVLDFIVPGETPFDTIDMLAGWAYSSEFKTNVYKFFQNKAGFNFRNIEQLIDEKVTEVSGSEEILNNVTYTFSNKENITDIQAMYVIKNMQQLNRGNLYSLARLGRFKNVVNQLDFVKKRNDVFEYSYKENGTSNKILSNIIPANESYLNSYGDIVTESTWLYRDSTTADKQLASSIGYKWAYHKLLGYNTIQLKLHGNSELTVGELIKLNIPSFNSTNPDNERREDLFMSGLYLIKDITHAFTPDGYEMDVVVCRSGVDDIDDTEL